MTDFNSVDTEAAPPVLEPTVDPPLAVHFPELEDAIAEGAAKLDVVPAVVHIYADRLLAENPELDPGKAVARALVEIAAAVKDAQ